MLTIYALEGDRAIEKTLDTLGTSPAWIDVTNITKEEQAQLQERFCLHPLTAEDLYHHGIRIKVEPFDEYLFCVFYGLRKTKTIEAVELDTILGPTYVLTNHKKPLSTTIALQQQPEQIAKLLKKGPAYLFHHLLDHEIDNFFPLLDDLDKELDQLEQNVLTNHDRSLIKRIQDHKKRANKLKRLTLQQRERINQLLKEETPYLPKKAILYFRDVYDHSIRVADSTEAYKEYASTVFETYLSTVSNNMNEVMKVLSIIATITLPLTVISSIYGTNFAHLPGSTFQAGFWLMLLAMVLLVSIMLLYFRRKKWI